MKLLQELLSIRLLDEEAIEVRLASDIWSENKDFSKTFIPKATYMVRQKENSNPVEYEVFSKDGNKRKLVATMDTEDLEAAYVPVRSNQTPDVEGFTTYRDAIEVEAFKYEGDTVKADLEGRKKTLKKGYYLIRTEDENAFKYDVQSSNDFEDAYSEKK
jgi:hypothetical protein